MSVQTIAVVGAGTMGTGIAQVAAATGLQVILIDVDQKALSKAMERIGSGYDRLVAKGQMSPEAKQAATRSHRNGHRLRALASADLVIEAATENAELKIRIVRAVDKAVRSDAIISTNTSSVSITKLAACVSNPGRFIGLHFFNPVPVMKLVEVVRGLQTTDTTHDAAIELRKSWARAQSPSRTCPASW